MIDRAWAESLNKIYFSDVNTYQNKGGHLPMYDGM